MNKIVWFLPLFFLLASCSRKQEEETPAVEYSEIKEDLIQQNKAWHEQEMMDIDAYVKRHGWNVTTTGSGLKYVIYKKADTLLPAAKPGNIAVINYTISLLDDSTCYSSEGDPDEFVVNMDNVESGLHEGITYMRKGEKAKIILSSNLAYGLVGDMDKIPPQSPLVYDVELVDILDAQTKKSIGDEKKPR